MLPFKKGTCRSCKDSMPLEPAARCIWKSGIVSGMLWLMSLRDLRCCAMYLVVLQSCTSRNEASPNPTAMAGGR